MCLFRSAYFILKFFFQFLFHLVGLVPWEVLGKGELKCLIVFERLIFEGDKLEGFLKTHKTTMNLIITPSTATVNSVYCDNWGFWSMALGPDPLG